MSVHGILPYNYTYNYRLASACPSIIRKYLCVRQLTLYTYNLPLNYELSDRYSYIYHGHLLCIILCTIIIMVHVFVSFTLTVPLMRAFFANYITEPVNVSHR